MAKRAVKHAGNTMPAPFLIEFILDETGSMSGVKNQTIGGFNDFLAEQRTQQGQCLITLTKFEGGNLHTPYTDIAIGMAPEMTPDTFVPGGMTNLRDAIGDRITALHERLQQWPEHPRVMIVVMTDGADNMSMRHSETDIRALIARCEEKGWACAFLASDCNAIEAAKRLGFRTGNIKSFETAQMRETLNTLSMATTAYRAGVTKSDDLFGEAPSLEHPAVPQHIKGVSADSRAFTTGTR